MPCYKDRFTGAPESHLLSPVAAPNVNRSRSARRCSALFLLRPGVRLPYSRMGGDVAGTRHLEDALCLRSYPCFFSMSKSDCSIRGDWQYSLNIDGSDKGRRDEPAWFLSIWRGARRAARPTIEWRAAPTGPLNWSLGGSSHKYSRSYNCTDRPCRIHSSCHHTHCISYRPPCRTLPAIRNFRSARFSKERSGVRSFQGWVAPGPDRHFFPLLGFRNTAAAGSSTRNAKDSVT